MLCDSEIRVNSITVEERVDRPAARDGVQISFRFAVVNGQSVEHGTLMIPLSESISLGGNMMMAGAAQIEELKGKGEVDGPLREAILEVGAFVAGALQSALEALGWTDPGVEFEGCQGVAAAVPPVLEYEEGAPLIVGRAALQLGSSAPAQMVLVLPAAMLRGGV